MCTRTQQKGAVIPQETDPDLPVVSRSLQWRRQLVMACCRVGGTECNSSYMGPFEGGRHYFHYLHHSLTSGQITGKEKSPVLRQKNCINGFTHLEPDIQECAVKWALESITMNKASGGDGIPVELFQILKDDAVKVLHSICQEIWKTQQWSQDWKSQFSFQSQRKAMPKNAQATAQLHSSHMLAK